MSAVVFKSRLIPPGRGKFIEQRKDLVHIARYDVAVLIEAPAADKLDALRSTEAFWQMEAAIKEAASFIHFIAASNVKHIGPVDHDKQSVFLFNYFFADSLAQNLAVWEYTAGWFQQEKGLDNSTVLLPADQASSDYTFINH